MKDNQIKSLTVSVLAALLGCLLGRWAFVEFMELPYAKLQLRDVSGIPTWEDGFRDGKFACMQEYYEGNAYLGPLVIPERASTTVSNCWFLVLPPAVSAITATNEVDSLAIVDCTFYMAEPRKEEK